MTRDTKIRIAAMLVLPTVLMPMTGCASSANPPETEPVAVPPAPVYPATNRPEVVGREAAVSSDHPLATAAGYSVLRQGGNAVDAAVTMAAVLSVVRPHMNGVGGDAFALIYDAGTGEVAALNASGRAGRLATPAFFRDAGRESIPRTGAMSVTVPGAVAGWADALERHGTITLAEALAPAIAYAEHGFPVTRQLRREFMASGDRLNAAARAVFMPGGEPPPAGSLLRQPALAATLRRIAAEGPGAMYTGDVARKLAGFVAEGGGHLRAEDFGAHRSSWVEPLAAEYAGYRVLAMPPNTQGITLLMQMRLAEVAIPETLPHNGLEYLHRMVAVKQLAFADRDTWVADPEFVAVPVDRLLSREYARERAALIGDRALVGTTTGVGGGTTATPVESQGDGDTVYLNAVDRWGNAVSWIQSLFDGFGSGLLEPETGILLHNRGNLYTLTPGHPQVIAPGKRPFHTLTPHMAFQRDRLAMVFGTPGGNGQTQTLLQLFHNLVRFGMAPQAAVEAPRYRSNGELELLVEDRVPAEVRRNLAEAGYDVRSVAGWTTTMGGAQLIWIDPASGARFVASDPRREAYGLAY